MEGECSHHCAIPAPLKQAKYNFDVCRNMNALQKYVFLTCAMLCRLAIAIGNTHTKTNPEPEIRREPFVRTTRVLCQTYWYKWFGSRLIFLA